jgi:thiamine biosynthesis lipoprotein
MTPTPLAPGLSRRRVIRISAAASGLALLPIPDRAAAAAGAPTQDENLRVWHGVALGADATLQLHHPDPSEADRLIAECLVEVRRLERIFSLYRTDSDICRLNRDGQLDDPASEFVELLGQSEQFSVLTAGAFDPTVQPLWDLYARHFSVPEADPGGPPEPGLRAALTRIGHDAILLDPHAVRFARQGMAITLNGIAQGYVTDRVVALLRSHGIDRSLVDMGEIRAIGGHPRGGPWLVGLEDPAGRGAPARRIRLENMAVSTSGGYGTPLDPAGRFNHIFDPATGGTSWRYRSVSVVASASTTADALSTAFCLMGLDATQRIVSALGLTAYFARPDGSWVTQSA